MSKHFEGKRRNTYALLDPVGVTNGPRDEPTGSRAADRRLGRFDDTAGIPAAVIAAWLVSGLRPRMLVDETRENIRGIHLDCSVAKRSGPGSPGKADRL